MIEPKPAETETGSVNPYPALAPRFWHGMPSHVLWPLLARNGFRVSLSRVHMAAALVFFTPINDLLAVAQHLLHGRAIRRTKLAGPPVFIVGHWRSGTTLMHELLQLDDRFASPNTLQCFAPWHFLLTERLMRRFGNFLLPDKRPMDNMKVGWSLPQEDEFALMVLGAPTPYYRVAFPRCPVPHMDSLGSQSFKSRDLERWKKDIDWFFRALTYHTGKPLIIKSPPHTGRLGILAEMYPDARFIHMVRDPRKLYPSTKKMWRALDEVQSFQTVEDEEALHRYVIDCLHRMYDSFEIDRRSLPSNRIVDIRYEELVKQPVKTIESIYQQLEMGDAKTVVARMHERQASNNDYQVNQHQTNDELEKIVQRDWADYSRL